MFHFQIDFGQLIITGMIAIIGWFVNRTVSRIDKTLDGHASLITDLVGKVNFLTGMARWPSDGHHSRHEDRS